MCKEHWDMVPKSKQEAVYREYRKGQCNLKPMPSPQWFDAADAAIYAVRIIELNKITKELKSRIATLERQSEIQTSVNGQMGLHINVPIEHCKCGDVGFFITPDGDGDPMRERCGFCYTVPWSFFNVMEIKKAFELRNIEICTDESVTPESELPF